MQSEHFKVAKQYAEDIVAGKIPAEEHKVAGCKRFLEDLKRTDLKLNTKDADFVIEAIEKFIVHNTGEDLSGNPLMGKPLILLPWQVFIVYNLVGFEVDGHKRFNEAFIYTPRKNGKTLFVAGLAWGLSLLYARSGSQLYIVAASSKQAEQSFGDIVYSVKDKGLKNFKIHDTYVEHSIEWKTEEKGKVVASMRIDALASNPDKHDSFICNLAIVDELHAVPSKEYNRFKEAQKAFSNRLIVAITTAGDNMNSFGYRRLEYAKKVAKGLIKDDAFFCYLSMAEQDENGNVDYTSPIQHEKANPSYGVTIRPQDMLNDSMQAQNDPQQRKDFLSRSLNIYTTAMRSYFDIEKFRASDQKCAEALNMPDIAALSQLPIKWYGGADLSKLHDLTAACLYGTYKDIDICITHAFFPVVMAHKKAEEDEIPLFGWADDGLLTLCNTPTVEYSDVVDWFKNMRSMGFKVKKVAFDKKFGREFFALMKAENFNMEDAPQFYYAKSEGFRRIEKKVNDGLYYYMGSEAYEYCVSNVHAIEKTDDMIQYEKIGQTMRIDLFDSSVFACRAKLTDDEKEKAASSWEW